METENKPSDTSEICKVSVKIPPFLVEKPEIWFFQVEAQFKIGGIIQEDTKFNYLISQLEPKYIENIWEIINSKSDNKFSECKSRLLELFRESEGLRIKKLIPGIELGDMKPSQLLQKLRSLATPDISDNLIKTLWLDKLPTSIKNIFIVSDEDMSKLAIMADKINEINSSKEIYEAEVPSSSTDLLIAKLEDLERQVSELRLDRSRSRSKNRTQSRPRSNSQRSFDPRGRYCYYHFCYGSNCLQNKCRPPCSWKESENSNRRTEAIIGADFLNNFGLIIDIKNKRLIDGITNLSIRGVIQSISDMGNISTLNSSSKVSAILTKYSNLCRPPSDFVEAKHSVKHYISTRGQPIHSKARRLDSQRLTLAKAEFQYMLNNGIIRPSNSPWASPLHLVSKKDESLRPCGDYRRLNAVTLPDRYPIPRLDDFHHILKGTRVYSKIDLCKAFYQIPIAEEDKPKTAIITPFGLFEFNVMCFGLRNATATFQRFMHEVLRNLDFAFVYLDNILVASKMEEEHYSHLETLFSRLNSYGLRINISKSKFLVQEIDFLGYLITSHGVKPLPTKVKAILEYKKPRTVHELRIFLGVPRKKDRSEIKWTEEAEVQFEQCKQALANTALLAYPDTELPISLCTDASDRAVGSVLQQLDNNTWKPIAFFSKKLNPAQCNYSTYDRELLAIYLSIKFFKHLLEAREFTILTGHKPLIYAFKQKNEKVSPRQLRHLQYISQFTTDIKYIKGTDNIVADALSRVDAITTIDYEEIAKEQTGASELQNLISKNTSLKFKQCPLQSGKLLWCDVSTNNIRPFISIKFRMMVFRNFHELSHPGIKATTKQLTSIFIWPNMNKDIRKWAQACVNCQRCKVSIHTKSERGKYQEVDERFSVVHIDLIGPLPPSNGNIYCLTCIDRYTSWMEVVPLPDMKSETVARAFNENWIVRFGAPHTVISDQGKQFTSQLFKDSTTLCGIKLRHSTAYRPQCNGKIERLHRTIKTAIRAHNNIATCLRAAINKDNNHSLSQMVYGKTIRLPGEFFDDSKHHLHAGEFVQLLQKQMQLLKPLNEKHRSKTKVFVHKDLKTCSHVFIRTDRVRKPLEPPYEGPFPVLDRTDKYFTLKVKGRNVTISIDRLRPAYLLADSDNLTSEHPTAAIPIVSGALPSTSSQQNPDPPDVEKYTEFQGTGSAPDLTRTRSGRIIKKPNPDLTMSLAINQGQAAEASQKQLRNIEKDSIDAIRKNFNEKYKPTTSLKNSYTSNPVRANINKLIRCSKCNLAHDFGKCPAYEKECCKCRKPNHFSNCCKNRSVRCIQESDEEKDNLLIIDSVMVGQVLRKPWKELIYIQGHPVDVKLDTGANVNILPEKLIKEWPNMPLLETADCKIYTYTGQQIPVVGKCQLDCKTKYACKKVTFSIANNSAVPIPGNGHLSYIYDIKISNKVEPKISPAIRLPRALPQPVMEELFKMEEDGIIEKIEEPWVWAHPMVVVKKPSGKYRVCIDPRELNKWVLREHYTLPAPENILAEIPKAKFYSVLDAKSAFWQVLLTDQELNFIKTLLTSPPVLRHFDPNEPLELFADASKDGLGAILMPKEKPLSYASASLTSPQKHYSQIEKELLALYFGCKMFHYFLYGRKFTAYTDHKPLVSLLKKNFDQMSPRLQRLSLYLLNYQFDLKFIPGKSMIPADTLSRHFLPQEQMKDKELDLCTQTFVLNVEIKDQRLTRLQKDTLNDKECRLLKQYILTGWLLHKKNLPSNLKPYWEFKEELHEWQNLICREPMLPHQAPDYPWQKVGIDIFQIESLRYLLIVDYFSKYPEIYQLQDMTTDTIIRKLKRTFSNFGIPETLSNGMVERTVQTLKKLIMGTCLSTSGPDIATASSPIRRFFLKKIQAVQDSTCFCGLGEQTSIHLLLECPVFQDYRVNNGLIALGSSDLISITTQDRFQVDMPLRRIITRNQHLLSLCTNLNDDNHHQQSFVPHQDLPFSSTVPSRTEMPESLLFSIFSDGAPALARSTRAALLDAQHLGAFCQRLLRENASSSYHAEYEAETIVLRGSATPITRLPSQRARRALDSARLQAFPTAELAARWTLTVDVPRSIPWADLRRNCFSGHDADVALRLALHALPHPDHPASRRANCAACGSSDGSLAHRYWSCRAVRPLLREVFASCEMPLDFQAWLFGVGLHPEAVKLTSVAKATIYKYHLGLELGNVSQHIDLSTLWERTLAVHRWRSLSRGGRHQ
ncbi:hypothetical protein LAZ67_17001042 [Cordylochernes scorpioides]|uniref:RNA-directed DNA polymerase n=1 Tax=Cordylochernes scorpioides TaxID=51811 RepID=A0ABY6LGR2_9ARAC|nr:hypothetical protein LAZ67_17001042 [Cordylochernes scorpioides]